MKNTRILYQYRDTSNHKVINEVILSGASTTNNWEAIRASLEVCDTGSLGTFIPGQVGLRDLQNCFYEKPIATAEALGDEELASAMKAIEPIWWPDDHAFHELMMIDNVSSDPTDPRSIEEFVAQILDVDWDPEYLPPFHETMLKNYEKHLRKEETGPGI